MYGVTEVSPSTTLSDALPHYLQAGNSVLAHITDFLPYFYVAQPRGFLREDLDPFREYLNVSLYWQFPTSPNVRVRMLLRLAPS